MYIDECGQKSIHIDIYWHLSIYMLRKWKLLYNTSKINAGITSGSILKKRHLPTTFPEFSGKSFFWKIFGYICTITLFRNVHTKLRKNALQRISFGSSLWNRISLSFIYSIGNAGVMNAKYWKEMSLSERLVFQSFPLNSLCLLRAFSRCSDIILLSSHSSFILEVKEAKLEKKKTPFSREKLTRFFVKCIIVGEFPRDGIYRLEKVIVNFLKILLLHFKTLGGNWTFFKNFFIDLSYFCKI